MITENVKERSGTSETKVVLYFHTKHPANMFIDSESPVRSHLPLHMIIMVKNGRLIFY